MKATFPGAAIFLANVAFKPADGIITPRQFGPIRRISPRRASIAFSSSLPKLPVSLKPAEMITAPGTPAAAHSPITSGTVTAGVAMIARSTAAGTSAIFGKALTPRTLFRFRLIGYKVRPDESRFSMRVRPTLSGASVAPIKAIACGLNIAPRIGLRSTTAILTDFDFLPAGLLIFRQILRAAPEDGFSMIVQSRLDLGIH